MTDERLTDIQLHLDDKTGPPRKLLAYELLEALKAERARVAELEWEARPVLELVERITELEAKVAELEASCDALHNYISDKNIPELEARYKAASGLALSWGNYFNRAQLEQEIERIIQQEISDD